MKLLIKNGTFVDTKHGVCTKMDILALDGKICQMEENLNDSTAEVIDATGLMVSAGLVDMHVHLRDPGFTEKEDILTGTAAAARGGFTAIACMANTKPVCDSPEVIDYIREKASRGSGVQVYPVAAVTLGEKGETLTNARELKAAGAVALSDDGMPVMNANIMRDALIMAGRQKLPILCHEEDSTMVHNYAVNEGRISRQLGIPGRPAIAEEIMIARDALLAMDTHQPVHICHISTERGVEMVRRYKEMGVPITCETCPQYFTFTHEEVLRQASMARVNPPLRRTCDRNAMVAGLVDGTIDCIVTDHAPHTEAEKARPLPEAPSGMVGLETSLGAALTELYHTGMMKLPQIIAAMTCNPVAILQLENKGYLYPGRDADITIFDPDEEWIVDPRKFCSKGRNTPYAGKTLRGKVKYTIVAGKVIYKAE